MIESFREKYECIYESLMPTNMYGHNDNYHNQNKYVLAKKNKLNLVEIFGTGHEISIKKLALKIKKVIKFKGKIFFNSKFSDGTPKKILDNSKIYKLGWKLR
jgi:GDP-L-fucose synthase